MDYYVVPGGLRRGGLTPACGSAHARRAGSKRSGEGPWKRQITAKEYGVVLNQFIVLQVWGGASVEGLCIYSTPWIIDYSPIVY